jgi:hypothetical protein
MPLPSLFCLQHLLRLPAVLLTLSFWQLCYLFILLWLTTFLFLDSTVGETTLFHRLYYFWLASQFFPLSLSLLSVTICQSPVSLSSLSARVCHSTLSPFLLSDITCHFSLLLSLFAVISFRSLVSMSACHHLSLPCLTVSFLSSAVSPLSLCLSSLSSPASPLSICHLCQSSPVTPLFHCLSLLSLPVTPLSHVCSVCHHLSLRILTVSPHSLSAATPLSPCLPKCHPPALQTVCGWEGESGPVWACLGRPKPNYYTYTGHGSFFFLGLSFPLPSYHPHIAILLPTQLSPYIAFPSRSQAATSTHLPFFLPRYYPL